MKQYVNQILTTSARCVELSAHSPLAVRDSVTARDLRELPRVLVASPEQRDNEMTYYRDIVGLVNKYYDLALAGDAMAANHYEKLRVKASACVDCGHCDQRCPFHTPQSTRMKEIADYFGK